MKRDGSLYSVILVVLTGLLAMASCARPRNDAQIGSEVQGKIYGDPSLHIRQVTIQSNNGILTLNGCVSSDRERFAAAADAAMVAGVKTVVNNLQVVPPQQMQVVAASPRTGEENQVPTPSAPASHRGLQPLPSAPQGVPDTTTSAPQIQQSAAHRETEQTTRRVLAKGNKTDRGRSRAATETAAHPGSSLPYSVAAPGIAPPSSPVGAAQPPLPPVMLPGTPGQTTAFEVPRAASSPVPAGSPMPKPVAVTASAAPAGTTAATAAPVTLPPPPQPVTIPAGTSIAVRLLDAVDSGKNHPGDSFRATLDAPLVDEAGLTVVPAGYEVRGKIVDAKSAGRFAGSSALALELTELSVNEKQYTLQTNQYTRHGKSRGKSTVEKVGGGAALGAILGGLFGGAKGAAIGATVGAGAGTGVSAAGKGQEIVLRPETALNFGLQSPISVIPTTQPPHGSRSRQEPEKTASATGAPNPTVPSSTGDDGAPVLKRRGQ